jgi:hypothetical protein
VVIALFVSVGVFGPFYWFSTYLEWLCVFFYMTLTMVIMTVLPS